MITSIGAKKNSSQAHTLINALLASLDHRTLIIQVDRTVNWQPWPDQTIGVTVGAINLALVENDFSILSDEIEAMCRWRRPVDLRDVARVQSKDKCTEDYRVTIVAHSFTHFLPFSSVRLGWGGGTLGPPPIARPGSGGLNGRSIGITYYPIFRLTNDSGCYAQIKKKMCWSGSAQHFCVV